MTKPTTLTLVFNRALSTEDLKKLQTIVDSIEGQTDGRAVARPEGRAAATPVGLADDGHHAHHHLHGADATDNPNPNNRLVLRFNRAVSADDIKKLQLHSDVVAPENLQAEDLDIDRDQEESHG